MGGQAHVRERIGRFEAEQPAAHHHADFGPAAGCPDRVQVFDGAVDMAMGRLAPVDGRHEGVGAGGEHQHVVAHLPPFAGAQALPLAVDLGNALADMHGHARWQRRKGEVRRAGPIEVVAQMNAVVGQTLLLAEHREGHPRHRRSEFDEAMANHAVADNDDAQIGIGAQADRVHAEQGSKYRTKS